MLSRVRPTAAALFIAVSLLTGSVSACGGDDPESTPSQNETADQGDAGTARNDESQTGSRQGAQPTSRSQGGYPGGTEEADAYQAVDKTYQALRARNKNANTYGICALMSAAAKRETVRYATQSAARSNVTWTCPTAVRLIVDRARRYDRFQPSKLKIVGVNVDGKRGTATVQRGNKPATSVPLVKEAGSWKIDAGPSTP